jgi:hypothetical protein
VNAKEVGEGGADQQPATWTDVQVCANKDTRVTSSCWDKSQKTIQALQSQRRWVSSVPVFTLRSSLPLGSPSPQVSRSCARSAETALRFSPVLMFSVFRPWTRRVFRPDPVARCRLATSLAAFLESGAREKQQLLKNSDILTSVVHQVHLFGHHADEMGSSLVSRCARCPNIPKF